MNIYEEKQQAKKERLLERSHKVRALSDAKYEQGTKALQAIPFGQPILVGHHSERSDRAYRGRAVGRIAKSFELATIADGLARRADNVDSGGISSDDPDAIVKLEEKLLKEEELHAILVARNREARQTGQEKPYPSYMLTNSGANIRRIKARIAQLEHSRNAAPLEPKSGNGWKMYEDKEDNRIVVKFDFRPSIEICKTLRSYGFLWSPTRGAWVRKAVNARWATQRTLELLSAL